RAPHQAALQVPEETWRLRSDTEKLGDLRIELAVVVAKYPRDAVDLDDAIAMHLAKLAALLAVAAVVVETCQPERPVGDLDLDLFDLLALPRGRALGGSGRQQLIESALRLGLGDQGPGVFDG